ncbi:MAG: hypothetical protein KDC26_07415 [Armatimonadetes bacterium]|nr:hypothetical protein [Armatimonadota bacterium]
MKVELKPDFEVSDASCKESTGKTLQEWYAWIESEHPGKGRRDVVNAIYNATGRGSNVWWPTTIWVEYEASKGIVKKDGLGEGYSPCCTKLIAAPVDEVYKAFTTDMGWCGIPGTAEEGKTVTDDGGNELTWLRLRPGKDVRFDWKTKGIDNIVRVDVTMVDNKKGKTQLNVMPSRVQTRDEADGLRNAWGEANDTLKAKLEG